MTEKENKFKGTGPQSSMLQYTLNQALNKRESFLSGAAVAKLANASSVSNSLTSNYGRNYAGNKPGYPARTEQVPCAKQGLLSLQAVQQRQFGQHPNVGKSLRSKASVDSSSRVGSQSKGIRPAQYVQAVPN